MRKHLVMMVAIAAALPAATVGIAVAQGRHQVSPRSDEVIHVVLPSTGGHIQFLDFEHDGLGFGDQLVSVGPILHEDQNERVGTYYGTCWIGSKRYHDGSPLDCTYVLKFADGNITTQGLDPHGPSDVFFSVTGGTGAYDGANGQAEYIDTTQTDVIISLDE